MSVLRIMLSSALLSLSVPAIAAPTVRACALGDDVAPSLYGVAFTNTQTVVAAGQFAVSFPWTVGRTQAFIYNDRFNPQNYIVASAVGIPGQARCAVVQEGAAGEVLFLALRMTASADTVTLRHPVTAAGLAPSGALTALIAVVSTARGNDTIVGSTSSNPAYGEIQVGGPDADALFGSNSDDCLIGGAKASSVFEPYSPVGGIYGPMFEYMNWDCITADDGAYTDGIDTIVAGDGDDSVYGCESNDEIWLGSGNDSGHGDLGGAPMTFGTDDDHIYGEGGADTIGDWNGNNVVYGGAGPDIISLRGGNDVAYGDDAGDPAAGDWIWMGDGQNVATGGLGDDEIYGGIHRDEFDGGEGQDDLYGGAGDDLLVGGADVDYLVGGAGTDELRGGSGDDILVGEEDPDALFGEAGNDDLYGGMDAADFLAGGDDSDMLCDGNGEDEYLGGIGDDLLFHALASGVDPVSEQANVAAEAPAWSEAGIPGDFDQCSDFVVPAMNGYLSYTFGWSAGSTCVNQLTFDESSFFFCRR